MLPDIQTLTEAGRLIHWALQPRSNPATKAEYQHLLDRYRDQIPFRECVQAICIGLGIKISDVGELGIVLTAENDSIFAMNANDYRRSGNAEDRLIDGLILVAIIATMYPRSQELDEDPQLARPPITVEDVEKTLRSLCEKLEENSKNQSDPSTQDIALGLDEAWRAYRDRIATKTTATGRASAGTTLQMINRAFETLLQHTCVTLVIREGKKGYRPTWKYQVMIRETSIKRLTHAVCTLVGTGDK